MKRLTVGGAVLWLAACGGHTIPNPSAGSRASDSATVVGLGPRGFQLESLSLTSLPQLPFHIGAATFANDTLTRVLVVALEPRGARSVFEAQSPADCGDLQLELPAVGVFVVGGRPLLRLLAREHAAACVGASTVDVSRVHLLDARRDFGEVLTYAADSVNYGDDDNEEAPSRPAGYVHTYDFPNACLENGCNELTTMTLRSGTGTPAQYQTWRWNRDSTALVAINGSR